MKKVIPKFRTEEEEARFWDTHRPEGRGLASDKPQGNGLASNGQSHSQSHSPLDYPGEFTEVKEPFKFAPDLIKKVAGGRGERRRS